MLGGNVMSFYSNFQSDRCPCPITGNPINGLTEKVCIQAEKIFDAGLQQRQIEDYVLALTDLTPATVTYPLTFVSARTLTSQATVTDLTIERQTDRPCARVQGTVSIPVEVLYTDATGTDGSATATVSLPIDVLLYVPSPSIMPFSVNAVVSVVATNGTFNAEGVTFTSDLCVTMILKISMPVELLVPTYGYCAIPPVQEYSQEVCAGFFELPLYPQGRGGGCCNHQNNGNNPGCGN